MAAYEVLLLNTAIPQIQAAQSGDTYVVPRDIAFNAGVNVVSNDVTIYGVTVGRGAGAVSTNTAVGASALAANTSGVQNNAFGNLALTSATSNGYNDAFGYTALQYNTGAGNAAFGNSAMRGVNGSSTGGSNAAFGASALIGLTTGANNVAVGNSALQANTTASNNTAVGYQAGYSNQTGPEFTALGYQASYNATGGYSTALGYRAGYGQTSGDSNTYIGRSAASINTATGSHNSVLGNFALARVTSGSYNVAIGSAALENNTTASNNTAVGYQSLYSNTTGVATFGTVTGGSGYTNGTYNGVQLTYSSGTAATTYPTANIVVSGGAVTTVTLVSAGTGFKDTTTVLTAPAASIGGTGSGFTVAVATLNAASSNTAVGYQAGYSNTTGTNNAFFGAYAGYAVTTGQYNTFVGRGDSRSAGDSMTTGSKNTILGAYTGNQSGLDIRTASNYIVLSDGDGNPRGVFDNNGNLGIGVTSFPGEGALAVRKGAIDSFSGTGYRTASFCSTTAANADQPGIVLGYDTAGAGIVAARTNGTGQPLAFWTYNGSAWGERARITSGGDLLVGTQTALNGTARLDVLALTGNNVAITAKNDAGANQWLIQAWNAGTSGDNAFVQFATETAYTGRGSITYNRTGGLVAYNTTSDYRAKDILGPVANSGATIDALKVYEGKMKGATQSRPMLVAHEAQEYAPYAVTGEKDAVNEDGTPKYQQMDVSSLVPLLLAEIQSLRARVAQLEGK